MERAKREGSIVSFNQINLRDAFAKSIDLVEILVENRKENELKEEVSFAFEVNHYFKEESYK